MRLLKTNTLELKPEDVEPALRYIDKHWPQLTRSQNSDEGSLIGMPYPYIVPTGEQSVAFKFEEQYYWDSYFIAVGLVGKHQQLAEGMLENLLHLQKRFGMIPTANRIYLTSRSQPPLLTSYIFLIYETGNKSVSWLKERMAIAQIEYEMVWMYDAHPRWHNVHEGMSRYYDINMLHDLAEAASGWDMTPRFERKCLDYLPVDLNCLLYKYETDFAKAAQLFGDNQAAKSWLLRAKKRKSAIDRLMWARVRGFYFDYNYHTQAKSDCWSLAAYLALWSGVASDTQAKRLVRHMSKFLHSGGLSATTQPLIDMSIFGSLKTQWSYPNGWSPLHYFVCEGLERYGYHNEAQEIANRWIKTNTHWYTNHGEFLEKYNVVHPNDPPQEGVYPTQPGFAWTNSIYSFLANRYVKKP